MHTHVEQQKPVRYRRTYLHRLVILYRIQRTLLFRCRRVSAHRATRHRATRHRATGHRATRHRATGDRATRHGATRYRAARHVTQLSLHDVVSGRHFCSSKRHGYSKAVNFWVFRCSGSRPLALCSGSSLVDPIESMGAPSTPTTNSGLL